MINLKLPWFKGEICPAADVSRFAGIQMMVLAGNGRVIDGKSSFLFREIKQYQYFIGLPAAEIGQHIRQPLAVPRKEAARAYIVLCDLCERGDGLAIRGGPESGAFDAY